MSGATTAVYVAAAVSAAATVYSSEKASAQAKKASKQATENTQATIDAAKSATNKADAKAPNVQGLNDANAQAALSGSQSTNLTGPGGVDPASLQLGKNTLLGA